MVRTRSVVRRKIFRDHPVWSPRNLVFPGTASLPHVGFAIISANSAADFLWSWLR